MPLPRWNDPRHGAYSSLVSDLLSEAKAELYDADPDGFTPRRQELAERARDAGEPAVAKQISALRKPTRSAWVVNRLVRSDPGVRSRLDAMAADLGEAADGARIRELTTARSRLVDELTRAALAGLAAPAAALREEVTATFDAAIADPEVAGRLGTLVRAEKYAGFGPGSFTAAPPAPAPVTKPRDPAAAAAEREARRQQKITTAERDLAEADSALESALAAERDLEDTVRGLEAELAAARQRLAAARRQSYRAESRQQRATSELGRLRE
jgi:hypothetical protein